MRATREAPTDSETTRGYGRTDERHLHAATATGVDVLNHLQADRLVRYRGD